jgi:hypothetical protein
MRRAVGVVAVALLVLAGCTGAGDDAEPPVPFPAQLKDRSWVVVGFQDFVGFHAVVNGLDAGLEIDSAGRATLETGCRRGTALVVAVAADELRFEDQHIVGHGCDVDGRRMDSLFVGVLEEDVRWRVMPENEQLTLIPLGDVADIPQVVLKQRARRAGART